MNVCVFQASEFSDCTTGIARYNKLHSLHEGVNNQQNGEDTVVVYPQNCIIFMKTRLFFLLLFLFPLTLMAQRKGLVFTPDKVYNATCSNYDGLMNGLTLEGVDDWLFRWNERNDYISVIEYRNGKEEIPIDTLVFPSGTVSFVITKKGYDMAEYNWEGKDSLIHTLPIKRVEGRGLWENRFSKGGALQHVEVPTVVIPSEIEHVDMLAQSDPFLKEVIFEEGVKSIGTSSRDGDNHDGTGFVFFDCPELTSISLPSSVEKISPFISNYFMWGILDWNAKLYSSEKHGLTHIYVDAANPYFKDIDGVVYSKDGDTLQLMPRGRTGDFDIPDGVRVISNDAFYGCKGMGTVRFPQSVERLYLMGMVDASSLYFYSPTPPDFKPIGRGRFIYLSEWQGKTIFVPVGCAEAYRDAINAGFAIIPDDEPFDYVSLWGINILQFYPNDISAPQDEAPSYENAIYYTPDGRRISAPQRGVNIMRQSDGKVRKVHVR